MKPLTTTKFSHLQFMGGPSDREGIDHSGLNLNDFSSLKVTCNHCGNTRTWDIMTRPFIDWLRGAIPFSEFITKSGLDGVLEDHEKNLIEHGYCYRSGCKGAGAHNAIDLKIAERERVGGLQELEVKDEGVHTRTRPEDDFLGYISETLVPDLRADGYDATADDIAQLYNIIREYRHKLAVSQEKLNLAILTIETALTRIKGPKVPLDRDQYSGMGTVEVQKD